MNKYHAMVKDEAKALFKQCSQDFLLDTADHGGKSERPNLSLWLEANGLLAKHVEKKAKTWTKKDLLWINENSRHKVPYGDPRDSAFGALYKDILFELKKLFK